MRTAIRALICVPVCVALVWSAAISTYTMRADALLREAGTEMATWPASGANPAPSSRGAVAAMLAEARTLRPREPFAHELLGQLALWGPRDVGPHEAREAFAAALEFRPVSPYTWASFAEALYSGGEPGAKLEHVIEQAAALGPSEPRVQRVVADLGLAVWSELTPRGQAVVDRTLAAGIRRNPLELLRISERRGRLDLTCRHVIGADAIKKRAGRYCERWEITP